MLLKCLKEESCKLNNNKYIIALTQITNIEFFAFIDVLIFELFSRKVLFINRKDKKNSLEVSYFLIKEQTSRVNFCKIINNWNAKLLRYF